MHVYMHSLTMHGCCIILPRTIKMPARDVILVV